MPNSHQSLPIGSKTITVAKVFCGQSFRVVIFIFFFSDGLSLKIENENNSKKNIYAEVSYMGVQGQKTSSSQAG